MVPFSCIVCGSAIQPVHHRVKYCLCGNRYIMDVDGFVHFYDKEGHRIVDDGNAGENEVEVSQCRLS